MPSKEKLKRRNHTVNRSYLRRFANTDGFLTRVTLPGDQRIPISIDDATVIKNFYIVALPDGSETDSAEDAFSVIESAATWAIRSLVDSARWPIPPNVKTDIAGWAALQYIRGPSVRQLSREIAEGLSSVGLSIKDETGRQVLMKMPAEGVDNLSGPGPQLAFIRRQLPVIARMLRQRDWVVTDYRRKRLTTSDSPVVLFPAADYGGPQGVGIANASAVYVPLDRRVGLSMISPGRGDRRVNGTARSALVSNQAMARNARKYLFHHPDDDPLADMELPPPRSRELPSPADTAGLVEGLFQ